MNRTRVIAAGAAGAVLLAASSYASPWWELQRLRTAVHDRDAEAVSGHVDFPALRESVKAQLMISLNIETRKAGDNPFAALGQAMAIALINPLVDAVVSPAGVMTMLEKGKVSLPKPGAAEETPTDAPKRDYAVDYRGWDRFAVSSKDPHGGSFIFKRQGLWSWKLAAVELPKDGPDAARD